MNGRDDADDTDSTGFSRRTFMRATGLAAGAGLLGTGAAPAAADDAGSEAAFRAFVNPRVRRAADAWERGYRGRADRTIAITDSGLESRHPDIGPWNGVVARTQGGYRTFRYDYPDDTDTRPITDGDGEPVTETFEGVTRPGSFVEGADDAFDLEVPPGTERITLELVVEPSEQAAGEDTEDELEVEVDLNEDDIDQVAALRTETDRTAKYDFADPGSDYEIRVGSLAGTGYYEVTVGYHEFVDRQPERVDVETPMDGIGADDEPQLVGWNNDSTRYHYSRAPRDLDSHGTHCAGIMAGTGQASAVDPGRSRVDEPRTVLLPGETLSYDVEADAGTGVFASAYGQGIELVIEGPDGTQLRRSRGINGTSEESLQNNTAEAPATEDGTYAVYVRATEGEALPARVETVAVGAFKPHDRTGAAATGEDLAMHAGTGPGFSVFGVTNLGIGLSLLADHAEKYVADFNLRAVNMSWGYVGGAPLGALGIYNFDLNRIQTVAEAGVVPVAAAGNAATPANGNGAPAVADEAVSVVATGPLDGIAAYSSGGVGARDEETGRPYAKPDVTAIGGVVNDLDQAPIPGDHREDAPYEDDRRHGEVRLYSGKGGTSMAAPSVCGLAGLVTQAMEEDAPAPLRLPEPAALADADDARPWTLRVEQAVAATANTTAFHAAPYHRGKAPTYAHDDRDPYEGWGRVNAGAAVDAVSRNLLSEGFDSPERVGLAVPDDEQAVAGYVHADGREGSVDVSVAFSHYSGASADTAREDPHIDLFVYDALEPEGVVESDDGYAIDGPATGDPNTVASAQGFDGEASVSVDLDAGDVYFVVAKLVNVPGAVNGYDVRANLEFDVETDLEVPKPAFGATGTRRVDSGVYFGRQLTRVEVTVEELDADAEIFDTFPEEWAFVEAFSDGQEVEDGRVGFGRLGAGAVDGDDVDFTYFLETPADLEESGTYTIGPAEAVVADDAGDFANDADEFAGEDGAVVVAQDV